MSAETVTKLSELTNEVIDGLEAGFSLDWLIASAFSLSSIRNYSTNVASAFLIVHELTKPGREPQELWLDMAYHWRESAQAYMAVVTFKRKWQSDALSAYDFRAKAPTVPLAICRAALKVWLAESSGG